MKTKIVVLVVAGLAIAGFLASRHFSDRGRLTTEAVYAGLERTASGNQLASPRDPAVTLKFDPAFRYLGGQKFILYGVADTEQHFFAEIDGKNKLTSLYWIQFEEYLPGNSHQYDYDNSPLGMTLNGYEFYVDTAAVKPDPKNRRRGSDGALVRQFLQTKGYQFPDTFAYARLVHLTDESRRKELMVIYVDEAMLNGMDPDDLQEGGKNYNAWPGILQNHLAKIRQTLTLVASAP